MIKYRFYDRELSWLSFNYRVLQEAKDSSVPLLERLKFLAIYSSNLDEFFRVRVASIRTILNLKRNEQKELKFDPEKLLKRINKTVDAHQQEFGKIYREEIIPGLEKHKIHILDNRTLTRLQFNYINNFFDENIAKHLQPQFLQNPDNQIFLQNNLLYFAVELLPRNKKDEIIEYAIIEIPSNKLPRFIILPSKENSFDVIFLDDIIRNNLINIFPDFIPMQAYAIKLTRDAELYINDEFSGSLLEKIKKGLENRKTGAPCRFLFDSQMPKRLLNILIDSLELSEEDLIRGARYHNFSDFMSFPNPGIKELNDQKVEPIRHSAFTNHNNSFEAINKRDILLYYPYHSYSHVIDLLENAASDPNVISIKVTQYRVARNSAIVNSLIKAAANGKDVTAFVELKARFDEEPNIKWAEKMKRAGVKVFYSFPGLKVHSKLALIKRKENDKEINYCYLATGNFNETTAKIYTDFGFFTRDERITEEVEKVFDILERKIEDYEFRHLLVSQFGMRKKFYEFISNEIYNSIEGKTGKITAKFNSLEDNRIIKKLYNANRAGVKIQILCRGICKIIPGVYGLSENIEVRSIVDKYLEHARVFIFHNDGNEIYFLGSADWMKRNLSRRIEVAFPIYDAQIENEIKTYLHTQLEDNVKARVIDKKQKNEYFSGNPDKKIRSQIEIYNAAKSFTN